MPQSACPNGNYDDEVAVNELVVMVNVALGNALLSACEPGDGNCDSKITVDELVTAVSNAMNGCRASIAQ